MTQRILLVSGGAVLALVCGGMLSLWIRFGSAILLDLAGTFCL